MPFKNRDKPLELVALGFLNKRMELPSTEKQRYQILKKGYEGEVKFDLLTTELEHKFYILNDLQLEVNNSKFQIDSTIIGQDTVFPCEVKNYVSDYYYKDGDFFNKYSEKKITNPLHQLDRSNTLLRQFLQQHDYSLQIKGNLIFINPEFYLFQAPLDKPIIYPPHLSRFLRDLSIKPANLTSKHRKLAELLVKEHKTIQPYDKLPLYSYKQLRKGPTCARCQSFSLISPMGARKIVCKDCGHVECISAAVVRNVEELKFLFPEVRITTALVFDWCSGIKSIKTIRKILTTNYESKRFGKSHSFE